MYRYCIQPGFQEASGNIVTPIGYFAPNTLAQPYVGSSNVAGRPYIQGGLTNEKSWSAIFTNPYL